VSQPRECASRLSSCVRLLVTLVDDRQPGYTRHATAVARLSRMVGMRLGLDELELEHLRLAALLHDAGSLRLPFPHVGSRWDLPAEERRVWETHPRQGARMAGMLGLPPDVAATILGHHERWDGSGYPDALSEAATPLSARILGVCDVYDSARSGFMDAREVRLSEEEALEHLLCDEVSRFDQTVVGALRDALVDDREIGVLTGMYA